MGTAACGMLFHIYESIANYVGFKESSVEAINDFLWRHLHDLIGENMSETIMPYLKTIHAYMFIYFNVYMIQTSIKVEHLLLPRPRCHERGFIHNPETLFWEGNTQPTIVHARHSNEKLKDFRNIKLILRMNLIDKTLRR